MDIAETCKQIAARYYDRRGLLAQVMFEVINQRFFDGELEHPLIIRTSGVFGPGGLHTARGNFIELMLRLAARPGPIRVVEDHVASPTYAPALASRTADLIQRDWRGLIHIGGGTPISWFEYARLIFDVAGLKPELRATSEREYRTAARRPWCMTWGRRRHPALCL